MTESHDANRNLLARAHAEWKASRFEIVVTPPQGDAIRLFRTGGTTIDHACEGMEIGGLGSTVRVQSVDSQQVA